MVSITVLAHNGYTIFNQYLNILLYDILTGAVYFSKIIPVVVYSLAKFKLTRWVCSFLMSFAQVVTACLLLYLSTPTGSFK